jgi:hypothetical protein
VLLSPLNGYDEQQSWPINQASLPLGTDLQQYYTLYEKVDYHMLRLVFNPTRGSLAEGMLYMAFDIDPRDPYPATEPATALSQYNHYVSGPICRPLSLTFRQGKGDARLIGKCFTDSRGDLRWTTGGQFFTLLEGTSVGVQGTLTLEYDLTFINKQAPTAATQEAGNPFTVTAVDMPDTSTYTCDGSLPVASSPGWGGTEWLSVPRAHCISSLPLTGPAMFTGEIQDLTGELFTASGRPIGAGTHAYVRAAKEALSALEGDDGDWQLRVERFAATPYLDYVGLAANLAASAALVFRRRGDPPSFTLKNVRYMGGAL